VRHAVGDAGGMPALNALRDHLRRVVSFPSNGS
jgi:hypothetical protein